MCLTIDHEKTKQLKESGKKTVTVWKVILKGRCYKSPTSKYHTPYMGTPISPGQLLEAASPGTVSKTIDWMSGMPIDIIEDGGVHAYLFKYPNDPKYLAEISLEIECPIEDVVAVGIHGDIALTKLQLPEIFDVD